MEGRKRLRTCESPRVSPGPSGRATPSGEAAGGFANNLAFVHGCIGKFLEDDPYSYFALARSTKRLWEFYCTNDKAVRHMRYVWNLTRNHEARKSLVVRSTIFTCVVWQWYRDCKNASRVSLVEFYLSIAGESGDLRLARMVAPWADHHRTAMARAVTAMMANGKDDCAIQLMERPLWAGVETWKTDSQAAVVQWKDAIFLVACTYVTQVPKFYAYMRSYCSFNMEDTSRRASILLAILTNKIQWVEPNFAFFWNSWQKNDELELVRHLVDRIFTHGNERASTCFPLVFKRFFAHLSAPPKHGAHTIRFANGDHCILHIDPGTIFDEKRCSLVYWRGALRSQITCNVPTLYC